MKNDTMHYIHQCMFLNLKSGIKTRHKQRGNFNVLCKMCFTSCYNFIKYLVANIAL